MVTITDMAMAMATVTLMPREVDMLKATFMITTIATLISRRGDRRRIALVMVKTMFP